MAMEKILNTRLTLKYDTLENWNKSILVLKPGEVAVATVPDTDTTGVSQHLPAVLMKVGDGSHTFSQLDWLQSKAADVYSWAKAANKPEYSADEIDGLADYIAGEIQDSNTQYTLVKVNEYQYKLQSKEIGGEFADTGVVLDIPNDTEAINAINGKLDGVTTTVVAYVAAQIDALKLGETYETKTDAASKLTEAKNAAAAVQTNLDEYEQANNAVIAGIKNGANINNFADVESALAQDDTNIAAALAAGQNAQQAVDTLSGKVGTVAEGKTVVQMITESAGDIDALEESVSALVGEDTGKSARAIAAEELAKQLIPETAAESMDTLAEIAAWIQQHPEGAAAMNEAIQKNAGDIAANVTAIANNKTAIEVNDAEILQLQTDLETMEVLVGVLPEGATATTVVGYIGEAIAALKIGDYAKASDLAGAVERIAALEGKAHEHANKGLLDTYTQTEENLADAVAKKHEHANAGELDKIADGDKEKWDTAAGKAHEHANAEVINAITADDVTNWNGKANDADLAAVAKSGLIDDLTIGEGTVLIFDCGSSAE